MENKEKIIINLSYFYLNRWIIGTPQFAFEWYKTSWTKSKRDKKALSEALLRIYQKY
jgi:hypothetical protein